MSVVLGLDPGFACIGYAVVELPPKGGERLLSMGAFRTEKTSKKQKVFTYWENYLGEYRVFNGKRVFLHKCGDTGRIQIQ